MSLVWSEELLMKASKSQSLATSHFIQTSRSFLHFSIFSSNRKIIFASHSLKCVSSIIGENQETKKIETDGKFTVQCMHPLPVQQSSNLLTKWKRLRWIWIRSLLVCKCIYVCTEALPCRTLCDSCGQLRRKWLLVCKTENSIHDTTF